MISEAVSLARARHRVNAGCVEGRACFSLGQIAAFVSDILQIGREMDEVFLIYYPDGLKVR
ncbi:hypothetical protein ASG54_00170 [Aureimonas sp. Leaf460]|nr:hypothetical protein ASG62_02900 [Aureimonas sp. Leaf427]KQT81176.1 hypothetical protein ASG54_00170 [Aureimonas sp. Leaf460]